MLFMGRRIALSFHVFCYRDHAKMFVHACILETRTINTCLSFAVQRRDQKDEPTGFHLTIPFNRAVSCSSVQGSSTNPSDSLSDLCPPLAVVPPSFSEATDFRVPDGKLSACGVLDSARDDSFGFFLGGMVLNQSCLCESMMKGPMH
jgi:hypothetical protein